MKNLTEAQKKEIKIGELEKRLALVIQNLTKRENDIRIKLCDELNKATTGLADILVEYAGQMACVEYGAKYGRELAKFLNEDNYNLREKATRIIIGLDSRKSRFTLDTGTSTRPLRNALNDEKMKAEWNFLFFSRPLSKSMADEIIEICREIIAATTPETCECDEPDEYLDHAESVVDSPKKFCHTCDKEVIAK